ncbi:NifB/NifX family molybdenum-iron cluster-binding protein [Chloroflexota bacterium]
MKIAVSATGLDLDAQVDPRFGRCRYFVIVDLETTKFEALENSGAMGSGGVGVSVAQMIAGKGVESVITGNCGPNAHQALSAAGIKVITGITGNIQDAIGDYKSGNLQTSSKPNVSAHSGMNPNRSTGLS